MRISPERFLTGFIEPFLDGNVETITGWYEEPVLLIRPDGTRRQFTRAEFQAEIERLRQRYVDNGLVGIKAHRIETRTYGPGLVLADVHWRYLDRRGRDLANLNSTYVLREHGESYRVAVHISHNEIFERP